MESSRFRSRALHEGERYGDDPFVFLRELAQNARDAGATRIEVSAQSDENGCELTFSDNGSGMKFEDARTYLFRLYASSKESAPESAGRYGVGFWSVLRFEPDQLFVESCSGRRSWAIACSGDLSDIQRQDSSLIERGTRVCLRRDACDPDFVETVRARLSHYCRYLRRAGRRRRPLPVLLNGQSVHEPMVLDGPLTLRFDSREAEGVVGLGDEPRVELYARGLWVKTVSVLEELEPDATSRRPISPGEGLAPVVILNSDRLELVLSRDEPVDDRALRRLLKLARGRVDRLVEHAIEGVAPRSAAARFVDGFRHIVRSLGGPAMASVLAGWAILIVASMVVLYAVWRSEPGLHTRAPEPEVTAAAAPELGRPYAEITGYRGATIDVPRPASGDWSLTVESDKPLYFRALTLDRYDPQRGWRQRRHRTRRPHPAFACDESCVGVRMAASPASGRLTIPVPTGYRLDPSSVRWNDQTVSAVLIDDSDNPSIELDEPVMGLLSYRVGPATGDVPDSVEPPASAPLGASWERVVARYRRYSPTRAARSVTQRVRRRLDYDVSERTAERFREHRGLWTERVIATGAGDCDVKNGFNVLLFQRLGIASRLAVGIVTIGGKARSGLHAWTEYVAQDRWWVADATGRPRGSSNTAAVLSPGGFAAPEPALAVGAAADPQLSIGDPPLPPSRSREPEGVEADRADIEASARSEADVVSRAPEPSDRIALPAALSEEQSMPSSSQLESRLKAWMISPQQLWRSRWWITTGVCLAGFLVLGWWWIRRRRIDESVERRGETAEQRAAVAGMVRELLRGSAGWRGVSALGHRRILPTLEGSPLSLAEAITRSRHGRLWAGGRRSPLARAASATGCPVIDLDDRHFGSLITQTFDVVDLAAIENLSVTRLPRALSRCINPWLERIARVTCVWSRSLGERAFLEYDLSELKLREPIAFPRRAIVINPEHPEVRARVELFEKSPQRAAYGWIDWIVGQSMACEPYANRLRREVAREVFEPSS